MQEPFGTDSHTSSLGQRNLASHHPRFDAIVALSKAVDDLLQKTDSPTMQLHFFPPSILGHFEDCETDELKGDIITAAYKNFPKMNLAIPQQDGLKISHMEYTDVQQSTDLVITKLLSLIATDSCMSVHIGNLKLQTKTFIESTFGPQYCQAILELEAEHKLLCLCSAHWKAKVVIGQVFLWQGDGDSKVAVNQTQYSSQPLGAFWHCSTQLTQTFMECQHPPRTIVAVFTSILISVSLHSSLSILGQNLSTASTTKSIQCLHLPPFKFWLLAFQ